MKPEWIEQGLVMCGQCKRWKDKKVFAESKTRDKGRCQHADRLGEERDIVDLGCDKFKWIKEPD